MKLFYLKSGDVIHELKEAEITKNPPTGGHLHYVYTIKNEFSQLGSVLFCSAGNKDDFWKVDNVSARTLSGIKFKLIPPIISKITIILKLFLLLVKYRPSHILCSKIYMMPSVYIYSKLFNIPMIVSVHTDMFTGRSTFSKKLDKLILKKSYAIICHGPFLVEQVSKIIHIKSKVYEYNAISEDLKRLVTTSVENKKIKKLREASLLLTYLGRVEESKGVFDLYEAFKSIITNKSDISLAFAGTGNAIDELEKKINVDGLKNQVKLLGKLDRREISHLLNISSAVVTPTKSYFPEGRCMSAMEALVMDVPVIAPDYGPFPYLIESGINGLLFKVDDVIDLSKKLKVICEDDFLSKLKLGVKEKNKATNLAKNTYSATINKIILN